MIEAYRGVSEEEIAAGRKTSEGKPYTLNHSDELIVPTRYKGVGKSNANSQGWERNSGFFFNELRDRHPEYFSKKNNARIDHNESPVVDAKFVKNFPRYKGYENETIIHHHIGKDGQAVAVPSGIHKGSGEIHVIEDELGITKNGEEFSRQCAALVKKNPEYLNQNADELSQKLAREQQKTRAYSMEKHGDKKYVNRRER